MGEDFTGALIKTLGKGLVHTLTTAGAGHPRGMPDVFESEEANLEEEAEYKASDLKKAEYKASDLKKAEEDRAELINKLTKEFTKKFPSTKLNRSMSNSNSRKELRFNPLGRRSSVGVVTAKNVTPFKKLSLVQEEGVTPEKGGSRYKRHSQTQKRYRRKH